MADDIYIKDEEESQSTQLVSNYKELSPKIENVTKSNEFTRTVDAAKISVVEKAQDSDDKFITDFKGELKKATLKLAEVERSKAELEQQNIKFHSELLETQQLLNEQKQLEDKWTNKQKRRQYHYDGVKAIMEFVGIKTPMNLVILYFLTLVLLPFFLLNKLLKGTIGAIIAGAQDEDRPKVARGILWTMLCILFAAVIGFGVLMALGWIGIVELPIFIK